jgi:integrase/recombinase XerD
MIDLRAAATDYLRMRRVLGFTMTDAATLLPGFIDYLQGHDADRVTTELAVAWATQPVDVSPVWWRQRLGVVRGFAEYLHRLDPDTEVPAPDILPAVAERRTPYLYSDADIAALISADRHRCTASAENSRSQTHLRDAPPDRLAPPRRRRRYPAASIVGRARTRESGLDLLVSARQPAPVGRGGRATRPGPGRAAMTRFAPTLQSFFLERLMTQRRASAATVDAYRDTLRLLLSYAANKTGKQPSMLEFSDLDADSITGFLHYLETERGNSVRTRNARLAAIHSVFGYAAHRHPEHADLIGRVLDIPHKRFSSTLVTFLTRPEVEALLAAPDQDSWRGRRDHALLTVAVQTGLRVAELIALRRNDIDLSDHPHLRCRGKGRKQRCTPLTNHTAASLRQWLDALANGPDAPVFPNRRGCPLSPDAIQKLVAKHTALAETRCPSLRSKHVTPHVLRHTAAMFLREAGMDTSVIALWLGHESITSTQIYLHADLAIKERALAAAAPPGTSTSRYQPPDQLLAFLESL